MKNDVGVEANWYRAVKVAGWTSVAVVLAIVSGFRIEWPVAGVVGRAGVSAWHKIHDPQPSTTEAPVVVGP